jgi:hypothetical protein
LRAATDLTMDAALRATPCEMLEDFDLLTAPKRT